MSSSPAFYLANVRAIAAIFQNGDGTAVKDLFDNSGSGKTKMVRVRALVAVSSDSSSRNIQLLLSNGSTNYPKGTVAIPANAGNNGSTSRADLGGTAGSVDTDGLMVICIPAGWLLKAKMTNAVTAGQQVTVTGEVETFE